MRRTANTFLFFFQAEDGIRDATVTGVQTCALPISLDASGAVRGAVQGATVAEGRKALDRAARIQGLHDTAAEFAQVVRSEERRVGNDCRYRGPQNHLTMKGTQTK